MTPKSIALVLLSVCLASAQTNYGGADMTSRLNIAAQPFTISLPNSSTGTSANKLAKAVVTAGVLQAQIITTSADKTAIIWDAATGAKQLVLTGHQGLVNSAAWSPDGKQIASGSWDRTARIWDVASGKETTKFTHPDYVNSVAWSPDGKYLATGDQENFSNVFIWQVK